MALRGWFILIVCDSSETAFLGGHIQVADCATKKLQVIARSAFSAELRNCLEACQEGINLAILLHELTYGPMTPDQCAHMRDHGTFAPDVHLCTDNYGLFSATTKEDPSPGVDASMIYHVKALRYYLDHGMLRSITWTDNRDMLADGLTKGKVKRDAINLALQTGKWIIQHPTETWMPRATQQSN